MPDTMLQTHIEGSAGATGLPPSAGLGARATGWSARLSDKENNSFDAIRLALATLVVFAHSFFLLSNRVDSEPLYVLSRGQFNSGSLAVCMFFTISGFLVTRSYVLTDNLRRYLAKRVARIVPGFLAATFVGCVVLAPLTTSDAYAFFAEQSWLPLAVQALALRQVGVSGALRGNALPLIHGTLWTIQLEFDCYLAVALLGALGLLSPRRAWAVYAFLIIALFASGAGVIPLPNIDHGIAALLISNPTQWPYLFPFFFTGSAFYIYRNHVPKWFALGFLSAVFLVASSVLGSMYWVLLLGGTYLIVYAALSASVHIKLFGRRVDLSYGVYLYGWPVAQMLLYFTHQNLQPLLLFALTIVLTFCVAYASWRLIEYPSLCLVKERRV